MPFFDRYPAIKHFLKKNILPHYLWLRSFRYYGHSRYCPCCKGHFSQFIEVGPKKEPMLCPRCRSNDRDRFSWLFFQANPNILLPNSRILHIAPEAIFYKRFRAIPGVEYIAGDKFILQFGNTYPKDTRYIDITDLSQFADNYFDFIYCSHVLEYIKNDNKALQEFYRVLKPGRQAIISVPVNHGHPVTLEDPAITDPKEQERLYGDTGHIRYYGEDYAVRVQEAGFTTAFLPVPGFIEPEMITKCVINPHDVIHLCIKN